MTTKPRIEEAFTEPIVGPRPPANETPDEFYARNADVIDGFKFCATLQLRTPLSVLQHHGEICRKQPSELPRYGGMADGIWMPATRSWRDLGINLEELRSQAASDIGYVDADAYAQFLLAFRTIIENSCTLQQKLAALAALPALNSEFRHFWNSHLARDPEFPDSFFYLQLTSLPGVGRKTAQNLYRAGLCTPEQVQRATDAELLAVRGVGRGLVTRLRSKLISSESESPFEPQSSATSDGA